MAGFKLSSSIVQWGDVDEVRKFGRAGWKKESEEEGRRKEISDTKRGAVTKRGFPAGTDSAPVWGIKAGRTGPYIGLAN